MLVIIGGGITGLSLAYFLNKKGYDVTVIEKDARLGGNASWTRLGEFNVGIFYHIITSSDTHLMRMIKELSVDDKLFPIKTKMGFFQKGKIHPISTLKEFLFFPPLSSAERFRLGILIIQSKAVRDWHKLDNITASEWLSRLGGRGNYEKVWKPIMNTKFGPKTEEVVATDMWFRINRLTELRKNNPGGSAYFIKGGLKVFFDALEKKLGESGVNILKNCKVTKTKEEKKRISAIVLDNNKEIPCDKIISTMSLVDFRRILPEGYQAYADSLGRIKYLNNLCLILRLRERFSPYYQLNIADMGFPFTGIIGGDALYPPEDFGAGYVLYISKYLFKEDAIFNMDEWALLDYYAPFLQKICPSFNKKSVLDATVTKKNNVEPLHSLHYSKLIPSFEAPISGLYLLNTSQIYPEPTVLNASVKYADNLTAKLF